MTPAVVFRYWDKTHSPVENIFCTSVPLRGETYIPTPKKASKQKSLPEHNKQRQRVFEVGYFRPLYMIPSIRRKNPISGPGSYPKISGLNMTRIDFPTRLNQIEKLEKQIPGLAFNVFGWHNGDVIVHWLSEAPEQYARSTPRLSLKRFTFG